MEINVNLVGMEDVQAALDRAQTCADELRKAVTAVDAALNRVGMEIAQPPDKSGG